MQGAPTGEQAPEAIEVPANWQDEFIQKIGFENDALDGELRAWTERLLGRVERHISDSALPDQQDLKRQVSSYDDLQVGEHEALQHLLVIVAVRSVDKGHLERMSKITGQWDHLAIALENLAMELCRRFSSDANLEEQLEHRFGSNARHFQFAGIDQLMAYITAVNHEHFFAGYKPPSDIKNLLNQMTATLGRHELAGLLGQDENALQAQANALWGKGFAEFFKEPNFTTTESYKLLLAAAVWGGNHQEPLQHPGEKIEQWQPRQPVPPGARMANYLKAYRGVESGLGMDSKAEAVHRFPDYHVGCVPAMTLGRALDFFANVVKLRQSSTGQPIENPQELAAADWKQFYVEQLVQPIIELSEEFMAAYPTHQMMMNLVGAKLCIKDSFMRQHHRQLLVLMDTYSEEFLALYCVPTHWRELIRCYKQADVSARKIYLTRQKTMVENTVDVMAVSRHRVASGSGRR